jgi:hypothetical protein
MIEAAAFNRKLKIKLDEIRSRKSDDTATR